MVVSLALASAQCPGIYLVGGLILPLTPRHGSGPLTYSSYSTLWGLSTLDMLPRGVNDDARVLSCQAGFTGCPKDPL